MHYCCFPPTSKGENKDWYRDMNKGMPSTSLVIGRPVGHLVKPLYQEDWSEHHPTLMRHDAPRGSPPPPFAHHFPWFRSALGNTVLVCHIVAMIDTNWENRKDVGSGTCQTREGDGSWKPFFLHLRWSVQRAPRSKEWTRAEWALAALLRPPQPATQSHRGWEVDSVVFKGGWMWCSPLWYWPV